MNDLFWNHLFTVASTIEQLDISEQGSLDELAGHLESIEVLYGRSFDPVDAFKEYVAVTLCRSISSTLPKII